MEILLIQIQISEFFTQLDKIERKLNNSLMHKRNITNNL